MPETLAPTRIIIADDHAIFRDGLGRLLASQSDFSIVAEASDGNEAVSLTLKLKPDILLLDWLMPKSPGLEVLRQLAEQEMPVKVVLLTAEIGPPDINRALRLGVRGVVMKASPPEILLKTLRLVAKGERWVGGEALSSWAESEEHLKNPKLTSREMDVISEIRAGCSNREIARDLSISEETVKRHLSNIFDKLGVSTRLELAVLASDHDLFTRKT